ncbi:hypothetical protein [Pseudomonas sp. 18173]|uniref:hypothetical protein n=1 Tax=Pseudomonas sp. 18173 TaxID=3390055 RepID=UPI003D24BB7A
MKRRLVILLTITLSSSNFIFASTKQVEIEEASHAESFQYSDPVGGRYRTLTILVGGKVVRALRGENSRGGTFERIDPPVLSAGGNFVFLSQIESGEVEVLSGSTVNHEVAYCELVEVRSGCIIARETGEFCGGAFTKDGKWENVLYPEFNLISEAPKAKKYVDGTLKFSESPVSSFENLLACDPPGFNNKNYYRALINQNSFNLDGAQRERFEQSFKN